MQEKVNEEPARPGPSGLMLQGHWWTGDEGWVRVKEMSPADALFTAADLLRDQSEIEWIRAQPLWKALIKQGRKG